MNPATVKQPACGEEPGRVYQPPNRAQVRTTVTSLTCQPEAVTATGRYSRDEHQEYDDSRRAGRPQRRVSERLCSGVDKGEHLEEPTNVQMTDVDGRLEVDLAHRNLPKGGARSVVPGQEALERK